MTDRYTTTDRVRADYVETYEGTDENRYARFDRWLDAVERAAAEKALTDFADEEEMEFNRLLASMPDVFSGLAKERHQKREEAWERRRSAIRARARAEAYRQERGEQ